MGARFGGLGDAEDLEGYNAVFVADDVGDPVGLESACFDAVARGRVGYGRLEGKAKRSSVRFLEEHETDDRKELSIGWEWQHRDSLEFSPVKVEDVDPEVNARYSGSLGGYRCLRLLAQRGWRVWSIARVRFCYKSHLRPVAAASSRRSAGIPITKIPRRYLARDSTPSQVISIHRTRGIGLLARCSRLSRLSHENILR